MISNEAYNAIAALNLDQIKIKLMHVESGEGWSQEKTEAVEVEYRRFLYLMKVCPTEQIAPLVEVDIFWHYHILDTMKYAVDCEQAFGYFLHHYPYLGMDGGEAQEAERSGGVDKMRELYESTFEVPYASNAAAFCTRTTAPAAAAFCTRTTSPVESAFCTRTNIEAATAFCTRTTAPVASAFCTRTTNVEAASAFCTRTTEPVKSAFCTRTTNVEAASAFCTRTTEPVKSAFCTRTTEPVKSAFCTRTTVEAKSAFCTRTTVEAKSAFCTRTTEPVKSAFCTRADSSGAVSMANVRELIRNVSTPALIAA